MIRIPERSVRAHLAWATWHFQDIVQHRTGGGNPFGNIGVRYVVPGDPAATAALDAGVLRYRADPAAVKAFAADTDPDGRIAVPVLSIHAIDDPTAFVELEHAFAATMARAGHAANLVQVYTADDEHSYLADPVYPAAMSALLAWAEGGEKPTPQRVASLCARFEPRFGPGCRIRPDFAPAPLASRIAERDRP